MWWQILFPQIYRYIGQLVILGVDKTSFRVEGTKEGGCKPQQAKNLWRPWVDVRVVVLRLGGWVVVIWICGRVDVFSPVSFWRILHCTIDWESCVEDYCSGLRRGTFGRQDRAANDRDIPNSMIIYQSLLPNHLLWDWFNTWWWFQINQCCEENIFLFLELFIILILLEIG